MAIISAFCTNAAWTCYSHTASDMPFGFALHQHIYVQLYVYFLCPAFFTNHLLNVCNIYNFIHCFSMFLLILSGAWCQCITNAILWKISVWNSCSSVLMWIFPNVCWSSRSDLRTPCLIRSCMCLIKSYIPKWYTLDCVTDHSGCLGRLNLTVDKWSGFSEEWHGPRWNTLYSRLLLWLNYYADYVVLT